MNKIVKKLFIVAIITVFFFAHYAYAKTAGQIAKQAFPSVVILVMKDDNGQEVSLGSGFFVREDVVATNMHVLYGASQGYAKIIDKKTKYDISGVVAIDGQRDLVLLKLLNVNAPSLFLEGTNESVVGDEIYAVGNPMGLEGTFSKGIISSVRQIDGDQILQITAPISPGSSGGPVLNEKGKVIGVSFGTFSSGQSLNFAIPSSYLITLMKNISDVVSIGSIVKSIKPKSIMDDLGERGIDAVKGGLFEWGQFAKAKLGGEYTISLKNLTKETISNVYCLVLFYDKDGQPIDYDLIQCEAAIPPGLAKRVSGRVGDSVRDLTSRVEYRILDFQVIE
ncbi:MAG: serine protease [Candidatus Margulisiibacteriota bacterium]